MRVIAATHRDLPRLVKSGKFREGLFYRLNVINIPLPSLRDRVEDVPLLAHHFLRSYSERLGKRVRTLAPEAVELLCGAAGRGTSASSRRTRSSARSCSAAARRPPPTSAP